MDLDVVRFRVAAWCLAWCPLALLPVSLVQAQEGNRPNIVLLLADDLGWTGLRCFGSDYHESPHLDALAEQGMKFTHAYAACTVCSPTRASIMTGLYPARMHLTDFIPGQERPDAALVVPDWTAGLAHAYTTVAEALQAAGYRTGIVGKWHLARRGMAAEDAPVRHGFDVEVGRPEGTRGYRLSDEVRAETGREFLTDCLTDRALEFIDHSHAAGDPFFLYFAYNVPHTPIEGRPDLVERFQRKERGAIHKNPVYAAMVASLDESVGRITARLDALGITENTLVLFTSDNGGLTQRHGRHEGFTDNLPLRRGKGSAFEGGVRVPAIVRWPGHVAKGSVSATPVISCDYFPTLLAAAGLAAPSPTDGVSLLPLLKDPGHTFARDLFWHYPHYHAGGDSPYSAIRSGDWKLIEFHEDQRLELFNLRTDAGESRDLSAGQPDKARELLARLQSWRDTVGAQMPAPNAAAP